MRLHQKDCLVYTCVKECNDLSEDRTTPFDFKKLAELEDYIDKELHGCYTFGREDTEEFREETRRLMEPYIKKNKSKSSS